jgi:chorismate mutase
MPVGHSNFGNPAEAAQTVLAPLRREIDAVDEQILALISRRFEIVRRVARAKAEHGIAPLLQDRIDIVVGRARKAAEAGAFDPAVAESIYRALIEAAIALEEDFIDAEGAR